MAIQRKLVLGAVIVGSLLCVLVLRVNLERPLSWSMGPLRHFQSFTQGNGSGSRDSEGPRDRRTNGDRWTGTFHPELSSQPPTLKTQTSTAAKLKPAAENKDVSKASSRSNGVDKTRTRTSTKGPKPAGTTEPPFIGDTYKSEDIPPQTDCTDNIRSRVTKTGFVERFLKHIPVLQWSKDVSREQHQRLSRYPGAHGWGGIDYHTLEETLSVLNSSANWRMLDDWTDRSNGSECIRCAVVGNGGILKDSQRGKEIDGHHYVFRTNGAITRGFERDVGSRTTHYTFSTNTLMNSMRSYGRLGYRGPPLSKVGNMREVSPP